MGKSFNAKAWIYECLKFIEAVDGYSQFEKTLNNVHNIILENTFQKGKMVFPEIIGDEIYPDRNVNASGKTIEDDYCISLCDSKGAREVLRIKRDGIDARYMVFLNDRDIYRSYKMNASIASDVSFEVISKKHLPMDDCQIALLEDIYKTLGINRVGLDMDVQPGNWSKALYPMDYYCHDYKKRIKLTFRNGIGNFVINLNIDDFDSTIQLSICNGAVFINQFLKGMIGYEDQFMFQTDKIQTRVPYEYCLLQDETRQLLVNIVKVLKEHDIDVSELSTELTDQTQYS